MVFYVNSTRAGVGPEWDVVFIEIKFKNKDKNMLKCPFLSEILMP